MLGALSARRVRPAAVAEEAAAYDWSAHERAVALAGRARHFIGTPASVRAEIESLVKSTSASEVIVTTMIHDAEERRRSYELLMGGG